MNAEELRNLYDKLLSGSDLIDLANEQLCLARAAINEAMLEIASYMREREVNGT